MSTTRKQKQIAIEAVARQFGATCVKIDGASGGLLLIDRKRIALDVATLTDPVSAPGAPSRPHLRFDRVARRFVLRLQTALGEAVPERTAVIFTVTAPIRSALRTAEELENRIRTSLAHRPRPREFQDAIHGNRVRVRVAASGCRRASKVIGFVHNPEPDAGMLFELTQSLLAAVGRAAKRRASSGTGSARWLILIVENGFSSVETYRQVYGELSIQTNFSKILLVFAGRRIESLSN
jgi:hypothetical protein